MEDRLTICARHCVLEKKAIFSVSVTLDCFHSSDSGKTAQTTVKKSTKHPKFDQASWIFSLPHSYSRSGKSHHPKIQVTVSEVRRRDKTVSSPVPVPYGRGECSLDDVLERLRSGDRITHDISLEKVGNRDNVASGDSPDIYVGKIALELSLDLLSSQNSDEECVQLSVQVHGGINLPLINGAVPCPFALAKTATELRARQQAKATTNVAQASRNAIWKSPLHMSVPRRSMREEGIFVALIDFSTKKYIGKCIIPLELIAPGNQYNLGLILNEEGAYMLVTVYREPSIADDISYFVSQAPPFHLELLLRGFQQPLPGEKQSLLAVAHYIDNLDQYEAEVAQAVNDQSMKSRRIPFNTVYLSDNESLPSPQPSQAKVAYITDACERPQWNHVFSFNLSKDQVGRSEGGIVLEFFRCEFMRYPEEFQDGKRIFFHAFSCTRMSQLLSLKHSPGESQPLSQSVILVDSFHHTIPSSPSPPSLIQVALDVTIWDRCSYMKLLGQRELVGASTPVAARGSPAAEASSPTDANFRPPAAPVEPSAFVLECAAREEDDLGLEALDGGTAAALLYHKKQKQRPPRLQIGANSVSPPLPPSAASLLPVSPLDVVLSAPEPVETPSPKPDSTGPSALWGGGAGRFSPEDDYQMKIESLLLPLGASMDEDEGVASVVSKRRIMDRILKDREAMQQRMKKLDGEAFNLRVANAQLASENKQLMQHLRLHEQSSQSSMKSSLEELQSMPPRDLAKNLLLLSQDLRTEASLRKDLTVKNRQLQIKLLRKNEIKRQLLELQQAHKEQSLYVQSLQAENSKIPGYEENIRKQEKVISRLAQLLQESIRQSRELERRFKQLREDKCKLDAANISLSPGRKQPLSPTSGSPRSLLSPNPNLNPTVDISRAFEEVMTHLPGGGCAAVARTTPTSSPRRATQSPRDIASAAVTSCASPAIPSSGSSGDRPQLKPVRHSASGQRRPPVMEWQS